MNVICAKQRSTLYTVSLFSKSVAYKLSVLYTFLLAFGHELSAIPSCNSVVFMQLTLLHCELVPRTNTLPLKP